ncbi:hypothetical protein DMR_36480 [Solidesulfovibrio magneticus RS-1]|uniref:Uncharacterized protein n=1 Tax=Solidesulfovibrio magneticus (strain ATCC 700980 / DSM 13731 / RS-1) TaxID=573370 RepID=C4XM11_SOLM1|nr:hypothetical protein DMR_36480 [Solidesulfovibrio magneticus RS-1]
MTLVRNPSGRPGGFMPRISSRIQLYFQLVSFSTLDLKPETENSSQKENNHLDSAWPSGNIKSWMGLERKCELFRSGP